MLFFAISLFTLNRPLIILHFLIIFLGYCWVRFRNIKISEIIYKKIFEKVNNYLITLIFTFNYKSLYYVYICVISV